MFWLGKTKVNEIISVPNVGLDRPLGPSNFGYDSSRNDNLDSELGIPSISTLCMKSVKSSRYVPPHEIRESEKHVRRSQRVKYRVDRLTYSGFIENTLHTWQKLWDIQSHLDSIMLCMMSNSR